MAHHLFTPLPIKFVLMFCVLFIGGVFSTLADSAAEPADTFSGILSGLARQATRIELRQVAMTTAYNPPARDDFEVKPTDVFATNCGDHCWRPIRAFTDRYEFLPVSRGCELIYSEFRISFYRGTDVLGHVFVDRGGRLVEHAGRCFLSTQNVFGWWRSKAIWLY